MRASQESPINKPNGIYVSILPVEGRAMTGDNLIEVAVMLGDGDASALARNEPSPAPSQRVRSSRSAEPSRDGTCEETAAMIAKAPGATLLLS